MEIEAWKSDQDNAQFVNKKDKEMKAMSGDDDLALMHSSTIPSAQGNFG